MKWNRIKNIRQQINDEIMLAIKYKIVQIFIKVVALR